MRSTRWAASPERSLTARRSRLIPAWVGATSSATGRSAGPVERLVTSVRGLRLRGREFCVWSLDIRMLRMLAGQDRAAFTRIGRCDGRADQFGPRFEVAIRRSPRPGGISRTAASGWWILTWRTTWSHRHTAAVLIGLVSKRVVSAAGTRIRRPFRRPLQTWTGCSSPRLTRCNTVWRETPSVIVASSIGSQPSGACSTNRWRRSSVTRIRQGGEGRLDATIPMGFSADETTDVGKDTGSGGQPAVSIRRHNLAAVGRRA